ncbi:MAG: glycosyltransferase [Flavobacteriales bacterium]
MILYLTYNDQPSGVYWSQVTDVVEHLNSLGGPEVRLVALVSVRGYRRSRRAIRAHSPKAWVLPMVPTMARWKRNTTILAGVCRLLKPEGIIARGVFSTWMALRIKEQGLAPRVCFDGRGAYAAEWEEYRLIDDDALIAQFRPLEQEAVNTSDFRIAVSEALVQHWRERYGYVGEAHVVVPCTLGRDHTGPEDGLVAGSRAGTPFGADDVVLVYSGSTAGWQSFDLLAEVLGGIMDHRSDVKVLFLSKEDANNRALQAKYPGRVFVQWLKADEVRSMLQACDHGILVREDSITNRVASPTKFAEYLAAGLPVIISGHLGDFSRMVVEEDLGIVLQQGTEMPQPQRTEALERHRLEHFAYRHFTKSAFDTAYRRLLAALSRPAVRD